ncbi:hypothetical protein QWJ34_02215 [Saccharibacillus sp. CPCC 101409]|uniref:hypothetical protein n=1 Tax=Saccharibacillus sp. CPCC 101409 TaxID=3058041 RepID=UPI002672A1B0|nr:hypothetical protein [Saccharibacillus sp. CPCC 101409]MDO3408577.1 hypothetical protein [Saccharibacillus sp. CPCC 101409]
MVESSRFQRRTLTAYASEVTFFENLYFTEFSPPLIRFDVNLTSLVRDDFLRKSVAYASEATFFKGLYAGSFPRTLSSLCPERLSAGWSGFGFHKKPRRAAWAFASAAGAVGVPIGNAWFV